MVCRYATDAAAGVLCDCEGGMWGCHGI
jgi:hypothetical protein